MTYKFPNSEVYKVQYEMVKFVGKLGRSDGMSYQTTLKNPCQLTKYDLDYHLSAL